MAKPLLVEIFGDASQYTKTLDKAAGRTQRFGAASKAAGLVVAGGLAVGLEKSVKAALSAQESQARLEQAFKNAKIASDPLKGSIDALEASGRKLGFTDEATKNALGSLIVSTGSYKQSVDQMAIAQDLARFKSVDLETAVKALTMAHAGSLRPLKQLGIDIPKVTTAQDALKASAKAAGVEVDAQALAQAKAKDKAATFAKVLQTVTDKVGGQADAFANTTQGAMERYKAQMEHVKVAIGTLLLPALDHILGRLDLLSQKLDGTHGKFAFQIQQLKTIKPLWADIGYFVGIAADDFRDLGRALLGLEGLGDKIKTIARAVEDLYNWLKKLVGRAWNIIVTIHFPNPPSWLHKLPHLAEGGIVTGPTLALIGEKGPEAVVPLGTRNPGFAPAGAGGGTMVFNFPNYVGDRRELTQAIRAEFAQIKRRGGRV